MQPSREDDPAGRAEGTRDRGGLRADIVTGGRIAVGDEVATSVRRRRLGRRRAHHLEVASPCTRWSWCRSSLLQPRDGRAAHVPRRAVVGEDHAVALERAQHHARLRAESRETSKLAFSRTRRPIGGRSGSSELRRVVARGIDERAPRARRGEAKRVVDRAAAGPPRSGRGRGGSAGRPRRREVHPPGAGGWSAGSRSPPSRRATAARRRPDRRRTARTGGSGRGRRRSRGDRRRSGGRPRSARSRGIGYGPRSDSSA